MNSSRGRPAGGSDARQRLLDVARTRFLREGYAGVSVRAIAREAGVDHALVNYYFGSKQGLFAEALALAMTPGDVIEQILAAGHDDSPQQLAARLLSTVLAVWDQDAFRVPLAALVASAFADDVARAPLTEYLTREVIARIAAHIGGSDATLRASAVGTVVAGLVMSRYLARIEPMASMPQRDVVRMLAPMVAVHLR